MYVPDSENQLNYEVDETRLVKAAGLSAAKQAINDYFTVRHNKKGNKVQVRTTRIEDLTIVS